MAEFIQGQRVVVSKEGRRVGLRAQDGIVANVSRLSEGYISVRVDGRKRPGTWASRFWTAAPAEGGETKDG